MDPVTQDRLNGQMSDGYLHIKEFFSFLYGFSIRFISK